MKHDDLTKSCIFICTWALIFCVGLFLAGVLSKPFGLLIMATDTAVLIIKLKASAQVKSAYDRRRKYELYLLEQTRKEQEDDR